jgi:hypothetical protein
VHQSPASELNLIPGDPADGFLDARHHAIDAHFRGLALEFEPTAKLRLCSFDGCRDMFFERRFVDTLGVGKSEPAVVRSSHELRCEAEF